MHIRPFVIVVTLLIAARSNPVAAQQEASWISPVPAGNIASSFFDTNYLRSERSQHLGVDLVAPTGSDVRSPVTGRVTVNETGATDPNDAYLLIREIGSGAEHVVGHITSDLRPGTRVTRGQVIGRVAARPGQPTGSLVHWGVNAHAIFGDIGQRPDGFWGWDRAPRGASERDAAESGWIDLDPLLATRETISISGVSIDLIPHSVATRQTRCGITSDVGMELNVTYSRVSLYNGEQGWQPDGGCFFVFEGDPPVTLSLAEEIGRRWQGLQSIQGVQSYQVMYAEPNQIVVWAWGPFDADRVRQFLVSSRQPVQLTLARICCTSPPRN